MRDNLYILTEDMVSEFMRSFGASLDLRVWGTLIQEEYDELTKAIRTEGRADQLKEAADLIYVLFGAGLAQPDDVFRVLPEDEADALELLTDAATDLVNEFLFESGISEKTMLEAIIRVHVSNMSKLGDDGKPVRRADGKIMKGPNYKAPDLSDLVTEDPVRAA